LDDTSEATASLVSKRRAPDLSLVIAAFIFLRLCAHESGSFPSNCQNLDKTVADIRLVNPSPATCGCVYPDLGVLLTQ
jgi:hypothetical protein